MPRSIFANSNYSPVSKQSRRRHREQPTKSQVRRFFFEQLEDRRVLATLPAVDRGTWGEGGHADNANTFTGQIIGSNYNSFFVFNTSGLDTVTSATLRLEVENFYGPDASESLSVWNVSTPISTLSAFSGPNASVFSDLQSGTSFASFTVSSSQVGSIRTISLNSQAIAAINASTSSGQFAIGVHANGITNNGDTEGVRFSELYESRIHELVVVEENLAPVISTIPDKTVDEGSLLNFTVTATDLNALTYSLVSPPAGAAIHPTSGLFTWTPADDGEFDVTVQVTDDGSPSQSATRTFHVSVDNVEPSNLNLSLAAESINENGAASLSGSFTDPGVSDTHQVSIDWGDGSDVQIVELPAGVTSFSGITHTYLDDGPSPGNGTAADVYPISVTVSEAGGFQILSLTANNASIIDHNAITDDDDGGIAVSTTRVFYDGDSGTGRFNLADLSDGTNLGIRYHALTSNLSDGSVYVLGTSSTTQLLESGTGPVTHLLAVDGATGALTGAAIALSQSLPVPPGNVGIFAGWNRVVIHDTANAFNIDLPSGTVTDLGPVALSTHHISDTNRFWGLAEFFDGQVSLAYVRDTNTIVRTNVATSVTTTVATFPDGLSAMAGFTVDATAGRWYFHHEGFSGTFGGSNETLGFADATFSFDSGTGGTSSSIDVTVNNVAPEVDLSLSSSSIQENGSTSLTGTITDPGTLDTFTVDLDWGDPLSPDNTQTFALGATALTVAADGIDWNPATRVFALPHQYLDDNPSATESDDYTITVNVTDDDGDSASSSGGLYGLSSNTDSLYTIDEATGAATLVTPLGGVGASLVGLAFLGDTLYATDIFSGDFKFGTIDLVTGAFTVINNQGGSANWHGLAANESADVFYATNRDVAAKPLLAVTPAGVITTIGPTNLSFSGLGYDDANEILYGVSGSDLYRIDTATGAPTLVGSLGIGSFRVGLDYDEANQKLFANLNDNLYELNVNTGAATLIGPNNVNEIDGLGWLAGAVNTLQVTVNNVDPVAAPFTPSTTEDDPLPSFNVLASATDVGTLDVLQAVADSEFGSSGGVFTIAANGTLNFDPNGEFESLPVGQSATTSFTYSIEDDDGGTDSNTVTVTVNGVNDAPVATGESYTIAEDNTLSVAAPGVLDNDSDVDFGTTLTAVLVDSPAHAGSFTLNADGSFTYTPAANYYGPDSFTYNANDGLADSNVVTVSIDVTPVDDFDFGDAPASYGVASHFEGAGFIGGPANSGPLLGTRDFELVSQHSAAADGDDVLETDDEGGVTFSSITLVPRLNNIITVNATAAGTLDAWIDFNRNGVFDAAEKIADGLSVVAGSNELTITTPEGAVEGDTYARFRISTAGSALPTGLAADGEVEDYPLSIMGLTPGTSQLIPDPANPEGPRILLVNGTSYSDAIVVRQTAYYPEPIVTVYIAPFGTTASFPLASFGQIVVFGYDGSDAIVIEYPIDKPAAVYGDNGHDSIVGGAGNDYLDGGNGYDSIAGGAGDDILVGGADSDTLSGDAGRDLILGGAGLDTLIGGLDDDIELGGTLANSSKGNLEGILALWLATDPFESRITSLAGELNAATVIDDGAADYVFGSTGRDWLLDYSLRDYFFDFDPNPWTGDQKN